MAAILYGIQGADLQLVPTAIQTSAYNANAQDLVLCDATSAGFTVTLPAGAADKTRVGVYLADTASGHQLTIAGNGATFNEDGSSSTTLVLEDQGVVLQYNAALNAWYLTATVFTLAQLDARYVTVAGVTFTGAIAPAVVTLTDAATVAIDADDGNVFLLTLGGNRTMGTPSNPVNGQKIILAVTQAASGGPYTLAFSSAYEFTTALPAPTISTAASATDYLGFIYSSAAGKWRLLAYAPGY